VKQYRQRVSGPLLDRIDLQVTVPRLSETERNSLLQQERAKGPDSTSIRVEVIACRERQLARAGCCNARLEHKQVKQHCALASRDGKLLSNRDHTLTSVHSCNISYSEDRTHGR